MPLSTLANITVPFKIATHSFVYLGITVMKNFSDLFKENFTKLHLSMQQDLSKWSPLPLSLPGRVNVVKMSVLPKYLYLFQSLPIYIPNAFFKKLDFVITSYLWNNKKPRLRKTHLQKSKQDGGLALPNFRYYYWASNLRCLTYWLHYQHDCSGPVWVEMEKLSSGSR